MAQLPAKAKCVIIGAGIVGNSVLYHLARLGWKDLVQIDKGPLPNPGGSHYCGFNEAIQRVKLLY